MGESFVQVNVPTTSGKKLATYEFVNTGGDVVESEAVTLTDSAGNELLGQKPVADSIPVVPAQTTSDLANGAETPVGAAAVSVLAANAARKTAVVQNTGAANVRVGVAGVTATSGLRLTPGASVVYDSPDVFQGEIFAIREGGVDSIVFAQEAT